MGVVGDLIALDQLTIDIRTDLTQLRALWTRVDYLQNSILVGSDGDDLMEYTDEEVTEAIALINAEIVILSQKITDGLAGMATVIGLNSLANSIGITDGNLVTGDAASIVTAGLYTDAQIAAVNATIAGLPKITAADLAAILAQAGIDSGLLYDFLYDWLFNLGNTIDGLPGVFTGMLNITNQAFLIEYLRIYNDLNGQFIRYSTIEQTADAINLKVGALETYVNGKVSTLESGIAINAAGITSTSNRLDYLLNEDGTQGLIRELTTQIIQTADSLSLNATDWDNRFDVLTYSVGQIELKANSILEHLISQTENPDGDWINRAEYTEFIRVVSNADLSLTEKIGNLHAQFDGPLTSTIQEIVLAQADIDYDVGVYATAVEAGAHDNEILKARFEENEGIIENLMGIIVDADGVYVWDRTVLTGTVGNLTTTVEEYKTVTDGIKGEWGVTINALGYICGVKLLADYSQEEPTSDFTIVSNTFKIVTPSTVANPNPIPIIPFSINAAGEVTANILYSGKFKLDSDLSPTAAFTVATGKWNDQTGHFSCISRSAVLGFVCEKSNSGNGSALFGYCSNPAQTGAAVAGYNRGGAGSWGGFFVSDAGTGVLGETLGGTESGGSFISYGGIGVYAEAKLAGGWGVYTNQKGYFAGSVLPFTGSHIVYTNDLNLEIGQLVYSIDAWCFHISQNLILVAKTTTAQDKRIVGVVSESYRPLMTCITKNPLVSEQLIDDGPWTIKPEYQVYIDMLTAGVYQQVEVNSVGEGGILVCADNGDIENGDYLCSGNLPGHAMKQSDDLLHNYTVGKALEAVIWADEESTTKLIACTYHCG